MTTGREEDVRPTPDPECLARLLGTKVGRFNSSYDFNEWINTMVHRNHFNVYCIAESSAILNVPFTISSGLAYTAGRMYSVCF